MPHPLRDRQQLSNSSPSLISFSLYLAMLLSDSSRNFCVKVHIERCLQRTSFALFSSLLLLPLFFFCLWSMNCPKKKPKSSERDIRLLHSRCAASYIKTQKIKKKKKKKLDALRCVTAGGGEELKQHCGGWRCINFSNLSVLRRMNFSSFLNNFCLRVFILFFYHFMSCCYFVFFWAAELFQLLFFGFFS